MNKISKIKINTIKKNIYLFLVLCGFMCISSMSFGNNNPTISIHHLMQIKRVTINEKNKPLETILREIKKQSNLSYILNSNIESKLIQNLSISVSNETVENVLNILLSPINLTYRIIGDMITITQKKTSKVQSNEIVVSGIVYCENKKPVVGAIIIVKGTTDGAITDDNGAFKLKLGKNCIIEVSYLGMESHELNIKKNNRNLIIILKREEIEVEDVVVTGIYSRKANSFTGSSKTYTSKQLKTVGNQNLIQSLKSLDPALKLVENNQFGSDPNRTPDLEIRGKTSIVGLKEQFGEDPNQPLFILDGFETTLGVIMDISLDRIGSVTILKDAASTAIYGAKAANGVIVVETLAPALGKLRVSYNGNAIMSFPDLTDYNLMNAAEKLEFEVRSGRFETNLPTSQEELINRYNHLNREVNRGVDTYWLAEPLRYGINHRHGLYLEGGDSKMRYGLGVNYNRNNGVMKNSNRNILGANLDFVYRTGKLNLSNKFSFSHRDSSDPIVAFSEFSRANPYYRKTNEAGGYDMFLEEELDSDNAINYAGGDYYAPNPMWNYTQKSNNSSNEISFTNNTNLEYAFMESLKLRARFSVSNAVSENEMFYAPEDTRFEEDVILDKGSYNNVRGDSFSYQSDLTLIFGKVFFEKHLINAVLGSNINENSSVNKSYSSKGFPSGFTNPSFANQYNEGKPSYSDSKKRGVNFFFNAGYVYDNRYLMDINYRKDGSSVFGSNKRFTDTWAVGLAWNVHQEKFIKENTCLFSMLKIRGSVGNPGNQNFGSFNTITTYKFNNWMLNNFGTGVLVSTFGDPDLDWQKTIDKNIGIDISMLNNRFHISGDFYHKYTDPLLTSIDTPLSTGVTNRLMNFGIQVSQGFYASVRYSLIYNPKERKNWTIGIDLRKNKSYYDKIGESLGKINSENMSTNMTRYYDKASTTALYAVISAGIDPATGKEIFLSNPDKDYVFDFMRSDEVIVGDTNPDLEGVLSSSLYYKGFSLNVSVRYSFGAEAFNTTLYNKVENISGNDLKMNQDKRALHDRWQEPGDIAKFKSINLNTSTPMSSRFVSKNNFITLESVRIGYEFNEKLVKKIGLNNLTLNGYMNEIFRWSTMTDERGIDYPFARSFSFSLSFNF